MKTKKSMFAIIAASLLVATSVVSAASVTYTTSGLFNGASSITDNGITISYESLTTSQIVSTDVLNPTNISFGAFNVDASAGTLARFSSPFTLSVTQVTPTPNGAATQTFGVATIDGMLTFNGSNVFVTFPAGGNVLNFVSGNLVSTYTVDLKTRIVPSTSNVGVTTLQGTLQTAAVVPLPASVWGGIGLFATLGVVQLRRKLRA